MLVQGCDSISTQILEQQELSPGADLMFFALHPGRLASSGFFAAAFLPGDGAAVQSAKFLGASPDQETLPPARPFRPPGSRFSITTFLIAVNLLVFAGMIFSGISPLRPESEQLIRWGANYGPFTLQGQWWRLFTSMFLHIGVIHLLLNLWCLWNLGLLGEQFYGHWTFAGLYVLSGLGGSLASVARNPMVLSAGASGAIFGLAGALIATFRLGRLPLPSAALHNTLRSLLAFAGYNLLFGVVYQGIDNGAHVGGLVTGFILGALLSRDFHGRNFQSHDFSDHKTRRLPAALWAFPLMTVLLAVLAGYVRSFREPDVRLGLAERALRSGDLGSALHELQRAERLRPDDPTVHQRLGAAYVLANRLAQAAAEYERTLALDPANSAAAMQLARVYSRIGRQSAAIDLLVAFSQRAHAGAEIHAELGLLLYQEGRYQEALAALTKSTAQRPASARTQYLLGLTYMQLEKYEEATQAFQASIHLAPKEAAAYMALANALEARGLKREADQAYARAFQLRHPEDGPPGRQPR
jgi:rhomboid protease GluP